METPEAWPISVTSVRDGESTGLVSAVDHCVQKLDVDEYGLIIYDG